MLQEFQRLQEKCLKRNKHSNIIKAICFHRWLFCFIFSPIKLLKLKLLLSLSCVLLSFLLFSQNGLRKELDSLKKTIRQSTYYDSSAVFANGQRAIKIAKQLNDPDEEALIYQYYGNFYYFSYNLKKSKVNYSKSIEIAQKNKNGKIVNSTKIRLAFVLMDTDLLAAEKEFKKLLKEALKYHYTENTIEIYNGLGNLYDSRLMKDEALNYYLKGLRLAEKKGKKYHNAMMLNNIGLLKFNNDQVKEAEKDFKEGLKIIEGMDEFRLSLNLNNNLGLVSKSLKQYKQSINYYKNTLVNAKKLGFPLGRGVAFLNLSDSYSNNKDYSIALNYADSALSILKPFEQWEYVGMAYLIKSSIYRNLKNTKSAKAYTDSLFQLLTFHPSSNLEKTAHQELSSIYEQEGNYKLAFFHNNRFHAISDSLSEIANKDNIAQLQVIYGKEKVETDLENEKNKNSLLSKENELKQTRVNAIIAISIFVLLITIGLIYIRHVRLTRKQQQEFTSKLIYNIDQERSRISKDLHDDIGQSLSVIKSKINMFASGKINDISGMDSDVGEVIDQTRSISHALHPSFIQKLGLERSLVSLTETTQTKTGLICSLDLDAAERLDELNSDAQTQVYRIIQECINNTLKHANATALKISISQHNTEFIVKYQDNGIGISEANKSIDGIGLQIIHERAMSIQGKVQITSSKGKGYTLVLTFAQNA